MPSCQTINDQKTQVMPRALILFPGIAKPDDQFHRSNPARAESPADQDSPSSAGSGAAGIASAPSTGAAAAAAGASSTVGGTTATKGRFDSATAVTPSGMLNSWI